MLKMYEELSEFVGRFQVSTTYYGDGEVNITAVTLHIIGGDPLDELTLGQLLACQDWLGLVHSDNQQHLERTHQLGRYDPKADGYYERLRDASWNLWERIDNECNRRFEEEPAS